MTALTLSRFKSVFETNHQAGYFVDALAKLIDTVGNEDPNLCERALDGYVIGGLVAGLRLIGGEVMNLNTEIIDLIEQEEAAPQNDEVSNRGAETEGEQ